MRLLRFLLVGGLAAIVQFGTLALCLQFLQVEYRLSAAFAYLASVVFHFTANRYFTFRLCGFPKVAEFLRYILVVFLNFILTMITTVLVVKVVKLSPYLATAFSIAITVGFTFIFSKYWIFKMRDSV